MASKTRFSQRAYAPSFLSARRRRCCGSRHAARALSAPYRRAPLPDRVHEFVWRNWGLASPDKLAKLLGASAGDVAAMAESMGLPPAAAIPVEQKSRGYITLIRRNWHLLPYDQLLELLEMTPEQLAFSLREDDFLWVKLGYLKPKCAHLRYVAPGCGGPRTRGPDQADRRGGVRQRRFGGRASRVLAFCSGSPHQPRTPPCPPCQQPATMNGCRCDSSTRIPRSMATRCRVPSWIPIRKVCCSGFRPWGSTAFGCTSCSATWPRAGPPFPSSAAATSGASPISAPVRAGEEIRHRRVSLHERAPRNARGVFQRPPRDGRRARGRTSRPSARRIRRCAAG